jgi:hypothetical protein
MMSKCWNSGDTEVDVIADLRSVIARLEEAILTLQLKR